MRPLIAQLLLLVLLAQSALAAVPMSCQPAEADPPCHSTQDTAAETASVECELRCGQCVGSSAVHAITTGGSPSRLPTMDVVPLRYFPPDILKDVRPPISF